MASNEERRKVVACLRNNFAIDDTAEQVLSEIAGFEYPVEEFDAAGYLADLVDRPTCKIRYDSVHIDYVCNRCGQHYQYFETYDGDGHPVPFKYCPTCGSEVVEK